TPWPHRPPERIPGGLRIPNAVVLGIGLITRRPSPGPARTAVHPGHRGRRRRRQPRIHRLPEPLPHRLRQPATRGHTTTTKPSLVTHEATPFESGAAATT